MVMQRSAVLVGRALTALRWTQRELAENIGGSRRTVARWVSGESHLGAIDAERLARHVYPVDRDFASELLAHGGQTLVSAGLEAPPAPQPPPAPPPPVAAAPPVVVPTPAPSPAVLWALVEAIVCAAAEAADASPKVVRAPVLLVLRQAHELGLDLDAARKAGLLGREPVAVVAEGAGGAGEEGAT